MSSFVCVINVLKEQIRRLRLRCTRSLQRKPQHDNRIDPADHRHTRTKRCSCTARVNVRMAPSGLYHFASVTLEHNHPASHDDHLPDFVPPTQKQRDLVSSLASIKSLSRADVHTLLAAQFPEHPLTLRQVSNLLNSAKQQVHATVKGLGGDLVAIIDKLMKLKNEDPRWVVHVQIDETTRQFQRLFWMSPDQLSVAQRFSDVIINDIAMARNKYGLPLNIFVVIDHFFVSRNIAYALHSSETADEHDWALNCLFEVLPNCPGRVFFSDADKGLDLAISRRSGSEISFHGRCLNHLDGNVTKRLAPVLGPLFQSFREAFWNVYYSPSPAALERVWAELIAKYPTAAPYLVNELWPDRKRWAWAYVATRYTCGVRTSGRVEVENAVNKLLGHSKTTVHDLCMALIQRADSQKDFEVLRIREVCDRCNFCRILTHVFQTARTHHLSQTDLLFSKPLKLLRTYCVPFAVQKSFDQMQSSVFYQANSLPTLLESDQVHVSLA